MTSAGLFCPAGDFYIDPWKRVPRTIVTHAHSDHARPGMGRYWCSSRCQGLLKVRVGKSADIQGLEFDKQTRIGDAVVSLHPAGHTLGSAQVRIECNHQVAVVTGDHNATHTHRAAEPFTPVRCDLLISLASATKTSPSVAGLTKVICAPSATVTRLQALQAKANALSASVKMKPPWQVAWPLSISSRITMRRMA